MRITTIVFALLVLHLPAAFADWPAIPSSGIWPKIRAQLPYEQSRYAAEELEMLSSRILANWLSELMKGPARDEALESLLQLSNSKIAGILSQSGDYHLRMSLVEFLFSDSPSRFAEILIYTKESPFSRPYGNEGFTAIQLLDPFVSKERVAVVEDGLRTTKTVIDRTRFDLITDEIGKLDPQFAYNLRQRMAWQIRNPGKAHLRTLSSLELVPLEIERPEPVAQMDQGQIANQLIELEDDKMLRADFSHSSNVGFSTDRSDAVAVILGDFRNGRSVVMLVNTGSDIHLALDQAFHYFRMRNPDGKLKAKIISGEYEHLEGVVYDVKRRLMLEFVDEIEWIRLEEGLRNHKIQFNPKTQRLTEDINLRINFAEGYTIPPEGVFPTSITAHPASASYANPGRVELRFPDDLKHLDLQGDGKIDIDDLAQIPVGELRKLLDRSDWKRIEFDALVMKILNLDPLRLARFFIHDFENESVKSDFLSELARRAPKKLARSILRLQEQPRENPDRKNPRYEGQNAFRLLKSLSPELIEDVLDELEALGGESTYLLNIRAQLEQHGEAVTEYSLKVQEIEQNSYSLSRFIFEEQSSTSAYRLKAGEMIFSTAFRRPSLVLSSLVAKDDVISILAHDTRSQQMGVLTLDRQTLFNDAFDRFFFQMRSRRFNVKDTEITVVGSDGKSLELLQAFDRRLRDEGFVQVFYDTQLEPGEGNRLLVVDMKANRFGTTDKPMDQFRGRPRGLDHIRAGLRTERVTYFSPRQRIRGLCDRLLRGLRLKK